MYTVFIHRIQNKLWCIQYRYRTLLYSHVTRRHARAFAANTKYTETKAWIFGSDLYVVYPEHLIHVTQEELARYPTVKAYIDYIDATAITPHSSMTIDPNEASLLVSFLSQKADFDVKPQINNYTREWYDFFIEVHSRFYSARIYIIASSRKASKHSTSRRERRRVEDEERADEGLDDWDQQDQLEGDEA